MCKHFQKPKQGIHFVVTSKNGRAIAQAVSRWLPTAAARLQTRVY
jgi:hypothetical protein